MQINKNVDLRLLDVKNTEIGIFSALVEVEITEGFSAENDPLQVLFGQLEKKTSNDISL